MIIQPCVELEKSVDLATKRLFESDKSVNWPARRLSNLIRRALSDLAACEIHDDYVVDMRVWHAPGKDSGQCVVCLAGAVMAQTLDAPFGSSVHPSDYIRQNDGIDKWLCYSALIAIDMARKGELREALTEMGCRVPEQLLDFRQITPYSTDSAKFRHDMFNVVAYLDLFAP